MLIKWICRWNLGIADSGYGESFRGKNSRKRSTDMKAKIEYKSDMPRLLYSFFISYCDTASAPSFSKFARSIGVTLSDLESFRCNEEFDRAYRECNEIRKDYLIDGALTRRYDPSLVKFLLSENQENDTADDGLAVTIEVVSDGDKG